MWFKTVSSEALRKFMVISPSLRPSGGAAALLLAGASTAGGGAGGAFVSAGATTGAVSARGGVESGLGGASFCCRALSVEIPAARAASAQRLRIVFIIFFRLLLGV